MNSTTPSHAQDSAAEQVLHIPIQQKAHSGRLSLSAAHDIARHFDKHIALIERAALSCGILPERYARNATLFSIQEQYRICCAHVLLVGLGGLGGHVFDMLVRMGVGHITAADGDSFEPSNLNRQLLCSMNSIAGTKTAAAAEHALNINPAVQVTLLNTFLDESSLPGTLQGVQVIIDALGGLSMRLVLQRCAQKTGIPLVTAAVAGFSGYIGVVNPGETGPAELFDTNASQKAAEDILGTPAPVVACAAAMQCAEAIKIVAGKVPAKGVLFFDLGDRTFQNVIL